MSVKDLLCFFKNKHFINQKSFIMNVNQNVTTRRNAKRADSQNYYIIKKVNRCVDPNKMEKKIFVFFIAIAFFLSCGKLEYSPNQKFDKNTPRNINAENLRRIISNPGDDTIRFVLSGDSQNAYDDLSTFVNKVNATPGIDFVILNGDISDFGLLQEFKWIESYYSNLTVPYIAVIGNHDHAANGVDIYKRMYSEDLDFSFIYKEVKFVCIIQTAGNIILMEAHLTLIF